MAVVRWVEWASDLVEDWPDDVLEAPFETAAAEEGVQLAESVAVILGRRDESTGRRR